MRAGQVFVADGNAYFNRSGPRIVDSAGLLAACLQAVLRLVGSRHAKAATVVWRQIIKASSSNPIATRRVTGSSTASP